MLMLVVVVIILLYIYNNNIYIIEERTELRTNATNKLIAIKVTMPGRVYPDAYPKIHK